MFQLKDHNTIKEENNRLNYLKKIINDSGLSLKRFCLKYDISYGTMQNKLNGTQSLKKDWFDGVVSKIKNN